MLLGMRTLALLLVALALPQALPGQTTVHLSTQSRNVDFTAAIETKPFKAGTTLPAVCTVGSAFFKTDAAAGQNLYSGPLPMGLSRPDSYGRLRRECLPDGPTPRPLSRFSRFA